MANEDAIIDAGASKSAQPIVCKIGASDLRYALARGLADFNAMPTHFFFLGVIYPVLTFIFGEDRCWIRGVAPRLSAPRRIHSDRSLGCDRHVRTEPTPRTGSRYLPDACLRGFSIPIDRRHRVSRLLADGYLYWVAVRSAGHLRIIHWQRGTGIDRGVRRPNSHHPPGMGPDSRGQQCWLP